MKQLRQGPELGGEMRGGFSDEVLPGLVYQNRRAGERALRAGGIRKKA